MHYELAQMSQTHGTGLTSLMEVYSSNWKALCKAILFQHDTRNIFIFIPKVHSLLNIGTACILNLAQKLLSFDIKVH